MASVMAGLMAVTMRSSSRRVQRHQLKGRERVPPGGKRFGCTDQLVDQKGHQEFRGDVDAQQFRTADRNIAQMKDRLECLELHLDLPPELVQLQNAAR